MFFWFKNLNAMDCISRVFVKNADWQENNSECESRTAGSHYQDFMEQPPNL